MIKKTNATFSEIVCTISESCGTIYMTDTQMQVSGIFTDGHIGHSCYWASANRRYQSHLLLIISVIFGVFRLHDLIRTKFINQAV